jgi:acetyl esterase/lipase
MAILTYQPIKTVYVLGAVAFELCRFPLFMLKYFFAFARQRKDWSMRQAVGVRVFYALVKHISKIQLGPPSPLKPLAEKERFTVIRPAKDEKYTAILRSNPDIVPVEIGATWYPSPLSSESDKSHVKVLLHMYFTPAHACMIYANRCSHGGAFVVGTGRTADNGYMMKKFLKHAGFTHALCPQYRLSKLPASKTSNPFPAALQDSLTSYLYLINDLGLSPKDIVLSGDSAGANLAIALLRYLSDNGADLGIPNPSACILLSPWVNPADPTQSFAYDNDKFVSDYLSPEFVKWGTEAYAGLAGVKSIDHPYVNAKKSAFKTSVPLWVTTGGAEVLYYDDVKFYEMMKAAGNNVSLYVEEKAPHDVLLIGKSLGFDSEATATTKKAGEWLVSQRI